MSESEEFEGGESRLNLSPEETFQLAERNRQLEKLVTELGAKKPVDKESIRSAEGDVVIRRDKLDFAQIFKAIVQANRENASEIHIHFDKNRLATAVKVVKK